MAQPLQTSSTGSQIGHLELLHSSDGPSYVRGVLLRAAKRSVLDRSLCIDRRLLEQRAPSVVNKQSTAAESSQALCCRLNADPYLLVSSTTSTLVRLARHLSKGRLC